MITHAVLSDDLWQWLRKKVVEVERHKVQEVEAILARTYYPVHP